MRVGLVASRMDAASMGIWRALNELIKFREIGPSEYESDLALAFVSSNDIVYADEVNDWARERGISLVIFISRHEMRNPRPLITFHTPGNWGEAELGGKPGFVAISEPRVLTNLFREAHRRIGELSNYAVTLEATHHGPFIDKPAVFAEIGSTEREWMDERAHRFLASLIYDFLNNVGRFINDGKDVAISIGDLHYSTLINHVINGEYDLGHMIPKYIKLTREIVRMAVERNTIKPRLGIVHWKSIDHESRSMVEEELSKLNVMVVKRR